MSEVTKQNSDPIAAAAHNEKPALDRQMLSVEEAQAASDSEHDISLKQALRENWKACLWSMAISLTIVMEGYDYSLISNFFGYPSFAQKFGAYHPGNDTYQLSAPWQAGLLNGTHSCVMIGGFINGWASARYGYRLVIQWALVLLIGFIFIPFFATGVEMLLVGQMLCGLTWGVFATTGPAYASEVCPLSLRGYLTVYVNLCWVMGSFISSGVLRGMLEHDSEWSWRIPIALQWMWPLPIIALLFFAPESPWWLVRQGRLEDAEASLMRLSSRTSEQCKATLAQICHTTELEARVAEESSYAECFRGTNRRRTEICAITFIGQQLAGAVFADTPTYFFLQAGISTENAFTINIASTGMAFIGTLSSMILLSYFGRRTLYSRGMALLSMALLIVGICATVSSAESSQWAQVSFVLIWKLIYSLTVGPITYAIISETSAVRLRAQTVVIARNTYACGQIVSNILNPYMLNPTQWDWKGQAGFFWAGTALCTATWAFFRLPETKDRTYAELDVLFHDKVSARKFSKTVVDPHSHNEVEKRADE